MSLSAGSILRVPISTLYICYFGLREPLVQTQVLPYLRHLARSGVGVHLLTFEPRLAESWTREELGAWEGRLAGERIRWHRLAYHKRPTLPATLYDILAGARTAARLVRRERIQVIHARSHVPAAMGALAKRRTGARLIFDIRGFMPEEYTDAGIWPEGGYLYRLAKGAERKLMRAADGFVVLTEQARRILFAGAETDEAGRPVEVIPCCVDLARFGAADGVSREEVRRELNVEGRRVLVYVGALGGFYLTDEMADFLATAHAEDASTFSLILTQSRPEMIADLLRARGVAPEDFLVRKVSPAEVPRYLKAADIALSFIKPSYSKLSSSPTKMAEYLAAGLPVVCNSGVGDVDELVRGERVGVLLTEFGREAYARALREADAMRRDPSLAARCRESAASHFDLERVGGVRYGRLYRRLLDAAAAPRGGPRAAGLESERRA